MISKDFKIYHCSFNHSLGNWLVFPSNRRNHCLDCIAKDNYYIYTDYAFLNEGFATYQEIEKELERYYDI